MIRRTAAPTAIPTIRNHDAGRLSPIADQPPSRSRLETKPGTKGIGTSLGTIRKTLWPITRRAPSSNSSALNAREPETLGCARDLNAWDDMCSLPRPPSALPAPHLPLSLQLGDARFD